MFSAEWTAHEPIFYYIENQHFTTRFFRHYRNDASDLLCRFFLSFVPYQKLAVKLCDIQYPNHKSLYFKVNPFY